MKAVTKAITKDSDRVREKLKLCGFEGRIVPYKTLIVRDLLCNFNKKRFSLSQEKDTSISDNFIKKNPANESYKILHGELPRNSITSH